MFDLILGILFFAMILFLFKIFDRYKVPNLQAILVNYLVAGGLGVYFYEESLTLTDIVELEWIFYAMAIGCFFIGVFKLLADGAQKVGMAISTVANKMSVILPVIASFFLYGDEVTFLKIAGIMVALIGVVLSSIKDGKLSFDIKYLWLILIIFFGQGIADILFNYAQMTYVEDAQAPLFISIIFLSAFVVGMLMLTYRLAAKKEQFQTKSIFWGILLGIPNYLTVFYFFRALNSGFMESSQVYPILNMGVIVLSALLGFIVFREKLSWLNWLGIALCLIAIAFISF